MKPSRVIGAVLVVAVVAVGGAWMLQDRLIYFPGPDPGRAPAMWEELEVESGDGITLTTWYRSDESTRGRPVVVVFPGNAGNRAGRVPLGNELFRAGYGVVLGEYRGYGGNPGSPSEAGLTADALAMVRAVRERGLADRGIVYFGESLGAAVAIAAAATEPPDVFVLGSPFTSLTDVGRYLYPWLPVGVFLRDTFPSLERIERGNLGDTPAIVVGGTADRTVPIEQTRAIASALGAEIAEVEGADHNDPAIRSAASMVRVVSEFIEREIDRPNE